MKGKVWIAMFLVSALMWWGIWSGVRWIHIAITSGVL